MTRKMSVHTQYGYNCFSNIFALWLVEYKNVGPTDMEDWIQFYLRTGHVKNTYSCHSQMTASPPTPP